MSQRAANGSVCKLCGNDVVLIKAHVIPRSFWEIDPDQPAPRMITNVKGIYPKKTPIGVYDQTIVCERCERGFSDYDSYAADLLFNRFKEFKQLRDEKRKIIGYLLPNYDYRRLKLFTIAVLWRAAASSHSFFSRVRLGPFEEQARDLLLRRDPGDSATFAALFSVWNSAAAVMMDPVAGRWDGVRGYRFYLSRFVAYTKVDRRPLPGPFAKAALAPEGPLHVFSRELAASNDFRAAENVVEANRRLR